MAANTLRNHAKRTPMGKYINSTIQCHVVLDRLEQSAIDQIMKDSNKDDETSLTTIVCICFSEIIMKFNVVFIIVNGQTLIT